MDRLTAFFSRHRRTTTAAAALAIAASLFVPSVAGAVDQTIEVSANGPQQPVAELAIGDNLVVVATDLSEGKVVDVRLIDDNGKQVGGFRTVAEASGRTSPQRLWRRTGIVGCDPCVKATGDHQFASHTDARNSLAGRLFEIEVSTPRGHRIASRSIAFTGASSFRAYFSDSSGCLRQTFELNDDVFVTLSGAPEGDDVRLVLTHDRPYWRPDDAPFFEVRSTVGPEGQIVIPEPGSAPTVVPVWSATDTFPGWFAAILRTPSGSAATVLQASDNKLSHAINLDDRSTEAGVVINDWGGCPPPPEG